MIHAEHSFIPPQAISEKISNRSVRERLSGYRLEPRCRNRSPSVAREVEAKGSVMISTPRAKQAHTNAPDIRPFFEVRPGAARAIARFELQAEPPRIVIDHDLQRLIRSEMFEQPHQD